MASRNQRRALTKSVYRNNLRKPRGFGVSTYRETARKRARDFLRVK